MDNTHSDPANEHPGARPGRHKNQLEGAVSALDNVGPPVSGLVLTMLPTKGPDAYG